MSNEQILKDYPWLHTVNVPGEPERELKVSRVSLEFLLEKPEGHRTSSESYVMYYFFDMSGAILGHMGVEDSEKAVFEWILESAEEVRGRLAYIGKEYVLCPDGVPARATYTLYKRSKRMSINSMVNKYGNILPNMLKSDNQ